MRTLFGIGTPRALQGRQVTRGAVLSTLWSLVVDAIAVLRGQSSWPPQVRRSLDELIACA
jgi:hypothetical protein